MTQTEEIARRYPDYHPPLPPAEGLVTWWTCFWLLVGLASNVMYQPSGKLGVPNHRRTYLKSSPLFCAYNIFSIAFRLIYVRYELQISYKKSLDLLVHERFRELEPGESVEGFRDACLIRWIPFIFSGIVVFIKLASLKGVMWTQIMGSLFVVEWIVGEVLIWIAPLMMGTRRTQMESPAAILKQKSLLDKLNTAEHRVVVFLFPILPIAAISVFEAATGIVAGNFMWTYVPHPSTVTYMVKDPKGGDEVVPMQIIFPDSVEGTYHLSNPIMAFITSRGILENGTFILAGWLVVFYSLHRLILRLCRRYFILGNMIFVSSLQRDRILGSWLGDRLMIDPWAAIDFLSFLFSICVGAFGYRYIYDPTGTVNPSRSEIWG